MIRKIISFMILRYQLVLVCAYDYLRFKKYYSKDSDEKDHAQLVAWILQDKHRIEKALSLPIPRVGFGENVIKRLCSNLFIYKEKFNKDRIYYFGVGAIRAYEDFHIQKLKVELPDFFPSLKVKFDTEDFTAEDCMLVGTKAITKSELNFDTFNAFVNSRTSCRQFDCEKAVSQTTFESAVLSSLKTPSVCNRQHWRVHVFEGVKKAELLKLQNGNTGFTDSIPYLAVITSDLSAFYSPIERYQQYIDGGMFSMSFLYSLHSLGLGACSLNWSASLLSDIRLHKLEYIPKNESVIMMIAVGYAKDGAYVAKSPRITVKDVLTLDLN